MSRLPGTYRTKPRTTFVDQCPLAAEHAIPNLGAFADGRATTNIPRFNVGGTGYWNIEDGEPPRVLLRCCLGHQWDPSDGHVYPSTTTDKAS